MKDTRGRILEAALRVFAREGVSGATTREIARVAKVNEVTLFRHFKNKNDLLREAVLCSAKRYEQVFAEASLESPAAFRRTIRSFADAYAHKLRENEDLVRTFIGEISRHLKLCRSLFVESARTTRQKFIDYLAAAQKAGLARPGFDPEIAADTLSGTLMAGGLRRPLTDPFYDNARYVETAVDLFLKGIEK